jgi:hypothetical protein
MMGVTIHIYLLDEAVDVWRPTQAKLIRDDIYQITGSPPDDTEKWQFATGDIVRCRRQSFHDGEAGLVAYEKVSD